MKSKFFPAIVVCLVCQSVLTLPCPAFQIGAEPPTETVAATAQTTITKSREEADSREKQFQKSLDEIKAYDDLIVDAFKQTHEGWSSDEVILQDDLNRNFLKACHEKLVAAGVPNPNPAALNWRLLALRKAGKLKVKTTKRASAQANDPLDSASQNAAEISALAEIAMRSVQDRSKVSSDRIMTDPELRGEFEAVVVSLDPKADLY